MPELPEVETVRRCLAEVLPGKEIAGVEVLHPDCVAFPSPEEFARRLIGAVFAEPARRGKWLLLPLGTGPLLVVHLRMTGTLVFCQGKGDAPDENNPPHTHLVIHLEDGHRLRYSDVRRFGRFWLLEPPAARLILENRDSGGCDHPAAAGNEPCVVREPQGLYNLGPEPLGKEFTPETLARATAGRKAPIKNLLLKQELLAGLGNIYADECLFRAGVSPLRQASSLSEGEIERLWSAIREILSEAIRLRGTTFSDYQDGFGRTGDFRQKLAVYGREGESCRECEGPVVRVKLAGRSTFFCRQCQH